MKIEAKSLETAITAQNARPSRTKRKAPVAARSVHPSQVYAREIASRVKALYGLSLVRSPGERSLTETVKQWTASYFLPMLRNWKEKQRLDDRVEDREVDLSELQCVSRPKKGLKLPLIFAPGKKFDLRGELAEHEAER